MQFLMVIFILSLLSIISITVYRQWIRHAQLHEAYTALITNSHTLEQHYQRKLSYQTPNRQWPALPVQHTSAFCLRPQGDPHKSHAGHYTLKAVALDPDDEPRILKINQNGNVLVCASSKSRCNEQQPFFKGGGSIDQQCTLFHP
ncbi:type IV pilin protein [Neisseriaceae bacterium ESL0693]|nr:type IV pilin protein [Neisseriaceae bacterium ESL0693]